MANNNQAPQFPQIDPETLAQLIKTYVRSRQNTSAILGGSSSNYGLVLQGWADAITAAANPSAASFNNNDTALWEAIAAVPQFTGGIPTLLFFTSGIVKVGQVVYQVSSDTVAVSDFTSLATGPAIGIVTEIPGVGQARVQDVSQYNFSPTSTLPFLPLIPDTLYYVGASGNITNSPNPPNLGYLQEVGYAKTTLQLVLQIQEPTQV